MQEIILTVRSSSNPRKTYDVSFVFRDDGNVMVFCECPAGAWGRLCKHKRELIFGCTDWLADPGQLGKMKEALELLGQTNEGATYRAIYEELRLLDETDHACVERRREVAKMLERLMKT